MKSDLLNELARYLREPWLWVDVARRIAAESYEPPVELEQALAKVPSPRITDPESSREPLWGTLRVPHRDRGIRWLDKWGLLEELIPSWQGSPARRALRLNALEHVHLESWREGLDDAAFGLICTTNDEVKSGRLNGWALTALATLLAGGDNVDQSTWTNRIAEDLKKLGATVEETDWVTHITSHYHAGMVYLHGEGGSFSISPQLAVCCLSTLNVLCTGKKEFLAGAAIRAGEGLKNYSNKQQF